MNEVARVYEGFEAFKATRSNALSKKKISGKSLIVNSHFQNMGKIGKIEKMEESS